MEQQLLKIRTLYDDLKYRTVELLYDQDYTGQEICEDHKITDLDGVYISTENSIRHPLSALISLTEQYGDEDHEIYIVEEVDWKLINTLTSEFLFDLDVTEEP